MFFNELILDRYPGKIEYKRFDANLNQALAWVIIFQKTQFGLNINVQREITNKLITLAILKYTTVHRLRLISHHGN